VGVGGRGERHTQSEERVQARKGDRVRIACMSMYVKTLPPKKKKEREEEMNNPRAFLGYPLSVFKNYILKKRIAVSLS